MISDFDNDEYGNRWKQIVNSGQGPQPSYIFDTHNRITGSGVVYDNAGNMLQDGLGDTYTYDADSRMVGQQGFKYVVDALGNRVASTNISSGWETDYVYSGSTLVHRNDANANGWGFESGFGVYYGNNSSHFYRNYTDQVATERVQTQYSTSGSTVYETCENLAFGDAFPCQHPQGGYGGDVFWFAGLFTDPGANGNDNHAAAREYSGTQGRWESPDPAGMAVVELMNPQTWNRYAYVLNNPLSYTDPTGLECVWDDGSYDSNDDPQTGSVGSCSDVGGTWVDHSYFQQNYLADWSGAPNGDIANYAQNFTTTVTATALSAPDAITARIGCVKNLANAGSVQNAVGLGNATGVKGWLAGAFLGNNVASALDLMQSAWGGRAGGVANGVGQAFGSNVAVSGGKAAASQVPNVLAVNVNVAAVSVSTATTTISVQAATVSANAYPWGSLARSAVNTISGAFDGKLYFDIGIGILADYACLADGY